MCACFMCPLPGNVTHLSFVILLRAQRMNTEGELEVKLQKSLRDFFFFNTKISLLKHSDMKREVKLKTCLTFAHTASALASHLCLIRRQ